MNAKNKRCLTLLRTKKRKDIDTSWLHKYFRTFSCLSKFYSPILDNVYNAIKTNPPFHPYNTMQSCY